MGGGVEEVAPLVTKDKMKKSLLTSAYFGERRIWEVNFEGRALEARENLGIWNLKVGCVEQKALLERQL